MVAEAVPVRGEGLAATLSALRKKAAPYFSLDPEAGKETNFWADMGAGMLPVVGTAQAGRDFERSRREGDALGMGLSAAGVIPIVGKPLSAAGRKVRSTIKNADRIAFPGIYKDPKQLAEEAEVMVRPESENLSKLFGVTRDDLAKAAEQPGTAAGVIPGAAKKPKGTEHGARVMEPKNTRRILTALEAGRELAPELSRGMKGWYMTDPAFARLVALVGEEEAVKRMSRLNALTAMASPSSDVVTELLRGTAANRLAQAGRFGDFEKYAGMTLEDRIAQGLPEDIISIPSHAYHGTAQSPAMRKYLDSGSMQMKSPKVPLYEQASRPSALGRQSDIPVGDAHWSRAVGLPDVRGLKTVKGVQGPNAASVSTAELQELAPWWREEIAQQAGLEAVPAQATAWGLFSPQTGVDTPIGQPKLEIISDLIAEKAAATGVSPEMLRDQVLLGEADLTFLERMMRAQATRKPKK
jgi:hypothetical protein